MERQDHICPLCGYDDGCPTVIGCFQCPACGNCWEEGEGGTEYIY